MRRFLCVIGLLLALAPLQLFSAAENQNDGYVPMFNGKDLTGWVNANCAPGTFFVKDNEIITTGKPTGFLRTEKQYENFIAEFEWMHINKKEVGNSGFFVWADPIPAVGTPYTRGIEVQVLVNLLYTDKKTGLPTATSHGDLFSIHGARCKPDRPHPTGAERCIPSENRAKGGGEWNHYKIVAKDGVIKLSVNGKEVSGVSQCNPRKGYLALESEGAECHFRNLKIKELPSSNPKPEEIAKVAEGHKQLFTGLDLSGWKVIDKEQVTQWAVSRDWVLRFSGKRKVGRIQTEKEFGPCEYVVDFRWPVSKGAESCTFHLRGVDNKAGRVDLNVGSNGNCRVEVEAKEDKQQQMFQAKGLKAPGQWNRLKATLKAGSLEIAINGTPSTEVQSAFLPARGPLGFTTPEQMELGNLFVRELKK